MQEFRDRKGALRQASRTVREVVSRWIGACTLSEAQSSPVSGFLEEYRARKAAGVDEAQLTEHLVAFLEGKNAHEPTSYTHLSSYCDAKWRDPLG